MKLNIVTIIYTNRNDTIALRKLKFMNMIKKYILLNFFILLGQQTCKAIDKDLNELNKEVVINNTLQGEQQQEMFIKLAPHIILAATGGVLAKVCKLSPYGIMSAMTTPSFIKQGYTEATNKNAEHMIKTDYPHAQQWYNDLAKKYPGAHFDEISFAHSSSNPSMNIDIVCGTAFAHINKIYLNKGLAGKLNTSYEKKINGNNYTTEEQEEISCLELSLLHEAGHIKHNDIINIQALSLGGIATTEMLYQLHKKRNPAIPTIPNNWSSRLYSATKAMPKRIGIFAAMGITSQMAGHIYKFNMEKKADDFAIQHADMQALHAAANYFKKLDKANQIAKASLKRDAPELYKTVERQEMFAIHPPLPSRIASIENEIARREQATKTK
jgi:hypothetical protein